jgi:hypothetical protein
VNEPILTDAQTQLLRDLVEAAHRSSERFMMLRTIHAVWLQHPGFAGGRLQVAFEDVEALREASLVRVDPHGGNYGGYHFFTTPAAELAYERLSS